MKICTSYCFALVIFNKYFKIHYGDGDENVTSNVTLHNPNFFAIISSRSLHDGLSRRSDRSPFSQKH